MMKMSAKETREVLRKLSDCINIINKYDENGSYGVADRLFEIIQDIKEETGNDE